MRLATERERFQILGSVIPDGCSFQFMATPNKDFKLLSYVSSTWTAITGLPAYLAQSSFQSFYDIIHPEDLPYFKTLIEKSIKATSYFNCETRIIKGDSCRWLQITSSPHTENGETVWIGIIIDVTDRKIAEHNLIAEKERIQVISDNLPEGTLYCLVSDLDRGIFYMDYVSATWETITGIALDSIHENMQMSLKTIHPDDLRYLLNTFRKSEKHLNNLEIEIRNIDNKDKIRWIHISAHPRRDGNKVIWDGIIRNVTRRKEMEIELES
jgi:PAS domain S-box-containing protein